MSLDVLRGFDMFWIVGGGAMVSALGKAEEGTVFGTIRQQLTHVEWAGFRFYDCIFPLFVFIAGVSLVFSLAKARENGGQAQAMRRVLGRGLLLYLVGVFYAGGIKDGWEGVRWLGVLQRIALAYTGAGLLYLFLPFRALIGAWLGLLLGYWALMAGVPIRDVRLTDAQVAQWREQTGQTNVLEMYRATTNRVRGKFEPGYNVVNHFDFEHLPGKRWDKYYDPEGILSTFPAIATCLLGAFAGLWLRRTDLAAGRKSVGLAVAGVALVGLGYAWGTQFPVIKKVWSSSFVLVAGGWSLVFLATFHQVVDVWKVRWWTPPFLWIGMNALTIYLTANILGGTGGFQAIAARVLGGPVKEALGSFGTPAIALGGLGVMLLLARFLSRRGIFLRL
jgi:predicted acyltransferase